MSIDEEGHGLPDDLRRTRPYDLGVMLVHGIGQQRRGDTLEANGGALLESIEDYVESWLGAGVNARVSVERTSVGDPSGPEYFVANIDFHDAGQAQAHRNGPLALHRRRRWLIAESHWADVFPAPSYRETAYWAWNVMPVVAAFHAGRSLRRAHAQFYNPDSNDNAFRRGWRVLKAWAGAGAIAALVPPVMGGLFALLGVALLPLPFVKEPARLVQRLLAASVGDSYVLLERVVSSERIRDRVRRDMCWLGERCERVAMLAHSQGGAVAHEVVRNNPRMPCDLLLTYGSGLRKLAMIKRYLNDITVRPESAGAKGSSVFAFGPNEELRTSLFMLSAPWLALALHLLFAGGSDYLLLTSQSSLRALLPSPLVMSVALALWVAGLIVVRCWSRHLYPQEESCHETASAAPRLDRDTATRLKHVRLNRQLFHDHYELVNANTRWLDIYSTHDPVSNGPLLDEYFPHSLETQEVAVSASILTDHTSYWKSRDDFLLSVTRQLFETDQGAPRESDEAAAPPLARLRVATDRRRLRVAWTTLSGMATAAFALLTLTRLWTGPPELYVRLVLNVAEMLRAVPLVGVPIAGTAQEPNDKLLALIVTGVLAVASYLVLRLLWSGWNDDESHDAVSCATFDPPPLPRGLINYLLAAAALVAGGVYFWLGGWVATAMLGAAVLAIVAVSMDARARSHARKVGQPVAAGLDTLVESRRRVTQYLQGAQRLGSDDPAQRERGLTLLEASLKNHYPPAGHRLGRYFEEQCQDYASAADAFRQAGDLGDAYCKVRSARLHIDRLGRREDGERMLRDAAERDGEEYAYYVLANEYAARDDLSRARQTLRAFVDRCPGRSGPPQRHRRSRYCAWRLSDLAETDEETLSALWMAFESGQLGAATRLADALGKRGDHAAAIEALRNGAALGSTASAVQLGELLHAEGDVAGAMLAWRRTVELATTSRAKWSTAAVSNGNVEADELALRNGAVAAAGLAALAGDRNRPLASRRVADHALELAGRAVRETCQNEHGRQYLPAHAGIQRLAVERSKPAYARGDTDAGDANARIALEFGAVEGGLLLTEVWRGKDLARAEAYARRAADLEARLPGDVDALSAHRALSRLLEDVEDAQDEVVSLLRAAVLWGPTRGSDTEAVRRIAFWLSEFEYRYGREFPDLDEFLAEVLSQWDLAYSRLLVVEKVLSGSTTAARLQQAARIVEQTMCGTQAEAVWQRHLSERVAERLAWATG